MQAQPSAQLIDHWRRSLAVHLPFARMEPDHVEQLARAACERYFAPEAVLLKPEAGIPDALIFLRQGRAVGRRVTGDESDPGLKVGGGKPFPGGGRCGAGRCGRSRWRVEGGGEEKHGGWPGGRGRGRGGCGAATRG